eukprot:7322796-Lingulodinium_polyedra.AAC.1
MVSSATGGAAAEGASCATAAGAACGGARATGVLRSWACASRMRARHSVLCVPRPVSQRGHPCVMP